MKRLSTLLVALLSGFALFAAQPEGRVRCATCDLAMLEGRPSREVGLLALQNFRPVSWLTGYGIVSEGNLAIAYKTSEYELLHNGSVPLSDSTRRCMWVRLRHLSGGRELYFLNTEFAPVEVGEDGVADISRNKADAKVCRDSMAVVIPEDVPSVLAGNLHSCTADPHWDAISNSRWLRCYTFLERASALDNGTRNAGRYNPSHIMFNMMHPRALTLCDGYAEAVLDFRDYSLRSIGMPGQVGKGGKKGSEDGKSVRVMSFNGRYWNNNVDLENGWDHRKFAVVTMLEELCPDVVGTQELFLQQIEYVLKCCPQYRETGIVRDPNGRGGHDSGIFYNTDKVECLEEDSFHLSPTPRVPSLGWDAASCRTVTWVRLRHKASGKEFIVVNTHLDHKGPSAREKALDLILDSMDEINPGRLPLVLTGDFNAQYDEASLDRVKRELKDARYEALDSDDRYTFNGFGKSWTGTIDYIWEKGFRKCRRFRVVTKKYHHIPFISDHYPIYADLVIF